MTADEHWLAPTLRKFLEILKLEPNWDSYGAPKIEREQVWKAIGLLCDVMEHETPKPWVVPTSGGSIQLEWHEGGHDLEVYISEGTMSWDDGDGPIDKEILRSYLRQITEKVAA